MYTTTKQGQSQINVSTLIVLELNPPGVLLLSRVQKSGIVCLFHSKLSINLNSK